ncbi:MAG: hypothetical protein Q9227_001290 [Pyrenula ochraceoflavens]
MHHPDALTSPESTDQDITLPDAPNLKSEPMSDALDTTPEPKDVQNTSGNIKLEELFDDDDDEEFPTSSNSNNDDVPSSPPTLASSNTPASAPATGAKYSDPEIMYAFYQRLFPFRQLFLWLNHHLKPSTDFTHREFAFTLQNDAYLRYQSFPSADLLRREILKLNPSRFEIGPVYTTNPRDRKTLRKASAFKPLSKEIVFDIDLTDYDDVRTCCSDKSICEKCWTFVTMSIKVVDAALRDDFGFNHIMWIYSGRRGAHAWISDKEARDLDDEKRKALAGYLEVIKGGAQGGKRVNVKRPLHPHISRSLSILKPFFGTILSDQEPFLSEEGSERLLRLLPDKALNEALRKKWSCSPDRSSARKWGDIDALAETGVSKTLDTKQLMEAKQDILLEYTYPRLDVAVSKHRNHLLKSPFVVHPGTGRVCVPITANAEKGKEVDEFRPMAVPTVTTLLGELDSWKSTDGTDEFVENGRTMRRLQDYEKTGLKPYVEIFDRFVKAIARDEQKGKRERDDEDGVEGMEF